MSENNITPAINIPDDAPQQLSAEEFQKRLYGWFQDRGLLTELRAHLRKQMITVLKDSSIGRTVNNQQKQSLSPKIQALNLLIGEFLLYHNYHYSLSVFSTEVPAISILPEFPIALNGNEHIKSQGKLWRFGEKDMWDLVETLGIEHESDLGGKIYQCYYKNYSEPLLTTIINCIKLVNNNRFNTNDSLLICSNYEEWLRDIGKLLQINNISLPSIREILNAIKQLVENERKRIRKEALEEFVKSQGKLEEEFVKRLEEHDKKWSLITNSLEIEKSKLLNEQSRKQVEVEQYSVKILKHQNLLQDRYHNLIMRERDVHKREYQMRQREECLHTQEQRLQMAFDSLYKEQKAVEDLQKKLQHELNEQRSKFNTAFFDSIQTTKDEIASTSKIECEAPCVKESNTHDDVIIQLQIENKTLQNINLEQRDRINELTERSSLLLRDLESTQAALSILTNTNNSYSGVLTAPPLLAPNYSFERNSGQPVRYGGGEDGSRTVPPVPSREFRNVPNSHDIKRRLPPRRGNGFSTSTSDEGTTSQVLQDARDKLRRLEEESEKVDRQYHRFKLKRAQDPHYRNFSDTAWQLNYAKESQSNYKYVKEFPGSSSNSLLEYIPNKKQHKAAKENRSPYHCSQQNLNEAGPSNVQYRNKEAETCKDSEGTTSSHFELDTSVMSLSHLDTSAEGTLSD